MKALELTGVGHVYDRGSPWEHRALRGVDLTAAPGEMVAVCGPNGAGKSTLFRILTGLLTPSEGSARLAGQPLSARRGDVAGCLQAARLQLFGATAGDDLTLDRRVGVSAAAAALDSVGLPAADYFARQVDELSGGEQRLLALAGALLRRPALLVLDEPLAGVDATRAEAVLRCARLAGEAGAVVVVLTPDPAEAARSATRVVELAPC